MNTILFPAAIIRLALLLFFLISCISPVLGQYYIPLSVASGFNEDCIANGIGLPASSTTINADGAGYVFLSKDFRLTETSTPLSYGLPENGMINSRMAPDLYFQLAPYNGNNTLRLGAKGASGEMVLVSPAKMHTVFLLATSGSGSSLVSVWVNFSDGTHQEFSSLSISDWYGGSNYATSGIGRISRLGNSLEYHSEDNPRLYQYELKLHEANYGKEVISIGFTKTGSVGLGVTHILAVSAGVPDRCSSVVNIEVETSLESALVTWSDPAGLSIGYDYYLTTTGEVPDYSTPPSGHTPSASLTLGPLVVGQPYALWLRSNCGGSNAGFWQQILFSAGQISATYTSGEINTMHLSEEPGIGSPTDCPARLKLTVPPGYRIKGTDVMYTMVARNGTHISDQRSLLVCTTNGLTEDAVTPGIATSESEFSYKRSNIPLANGLTGEVEFELRTWRMSGGQGCSSAYQYIPRGSWQVTLILEKDSDYTAGEIIYVDQNVSGGDGSGRSWDNAFRELADALKWSREQQAYSEADPLKIFVAEGTYKPMYSPYDDSFGTDAGRENAFLLVKNVQVYGGFRPAQGITDLSHKRILPGGDSGGSILSGDIGQESNNADNVHTVVIASGDMGNGTFNGFTVTGGNNERSGANKINGEELTNSTGGGGICVLNSTLRMSDVSVKWNVSEKSGGGIYGRNANLEMRQVEILNNVAENGGGMYTIGGEFVNMDYCKISRNTIGGDGLGSAVYNNEPDLFLNHVLISDNIGLCSIYNLSPGVIKMIHVTIAGNNTAGLFDFRARDIQIINSIIHDKMVIENKRQDYYSIYLYVFNSVFSLSSGNELQIPVPEDRPGAEAGPNSYYRAWDIIDDKIVVESLFKNPFHGNYSLIHSSPVINQGDNNLVLGLAAETQDLAGKPRLYGDRVDMGAYEYQGEEPCIPENITMPGKEVTYDGDAHSVHLDNPDEDLTVHYTITGPDEQTTEGNSAVAAGVYMVKASVTGCSSEALERTATLTILKAASEITAADQTYTYDGTEKSIMATLNHSEAALTYSPKQGYTQVGSYPVRVSVPESKNYRTSEKTVTLKIVKAGFPPVAFVHKSVTYDGEEHTLEVTGFPAGTEVVYQGNDRTLAGEYEVEALLKHTSYRDTTLKATLTILKAAAVIMAEPIQKFTADGTVKNVLATLNHSEDTLTYTPQRGYINAGTYEITVSVTESENYLKASRVIRLEMKKADFEGLDFSDGTFIYNGSQRSLAVTGLPAGATVTYTGNGQTEAGVYEVTAVVKQENHNDQTLKATLTIRKAEAQITAESVQQHTSDGSIKNVTAVLNHGESTLSYSPQQGYVNAGVYEVTVSAAESKNYLGVSRVIRLEVKKADFTGLDFPGGTFTYDGMVRSLAVSGLPAGATVTYTGNGQKDAGVYEVTAVVKQANHNDRTLKATLTIQKAAAEITGDALQQHTADGGVKYVLAVLNHSEGTLSYSPHQGYVNAGDYTITVSSPETRNYLPASRKIRLYIDKTHFTGVSLPDGDFTYNGAPHFIHAWNVPEGTQLSYTGNGQVNVGTYPVKALLQKEHYHDLEVTGLLRIHRAPAYIHAEAYQSYVYDGTEKKVQATLNHRETPMGYWPQQGYTAAGTYKVTVWAKESRNYQETTTDVTLFIDKARFEGVSLQDADYTYDGTARSLLVNGLPAGATVKYAGNAQVNAGTYRVTALVQQENYYDLELEADLTIHKAPQTITFGELGDTHLENDADFQLGAKASSGLPVKYGYTYEADQAPATVSETGWVVRHTSGQVQITAYQEGNANYHAADPVSRLLQINSSDATLHAVTLGVETHERPESSIRYVMDCEDNADSVQVFLKTEVGASVQPGRVFSIAVPGPGIHRQVVTIASQDGTQTREYEIWVEKRFRKEEIVVEKFNSILLVNNNTETNGGYRFTDYEWQLNGIPVGRGQYFSQGSGSLDAGVYRVRMKTESGDWLSTCDFGFESAAPLNLTLYPNPVVSGRQVKIKSDRAGGHIRVLELNGRQVLAGELKGREGEFDLPEETAPGIYILQYRVEGEVRNLRFVVEK